MHLCDEPNSLNHVDFSPEELNRAVGGGKECEVPAHTDVAACEEFCAALTDDNRPGLCDLAGVQLNASVFGVTVSAVPC